jgi:hypothetical protein
VRYRYAVLCAQGVYHTAINSLTTSELARLARGGVNHTRDVMCAHDPTKPATRAAEGAAIRPKCEIGTAGLDEADGRLELVRVGGCG